MRESNSRDHVMDIIFEQDRRVIELNARTLAKIALDFKKGSSVSGATWLHQETGVALKSAGAWGTT